jgi:hypothetical protein
MFCIKNIQKGFIAYILTIVILAIMLAILGGIAILTIDEYKIIGNTLKSSQAYYAAESGVEDAIYRIKNSISLSPHYNMTVDFSPIEVLVGSPSSNSRIITTIGNTAKDFRKVEVNLSVTSIRPEFFYGVQAGDLGVTLSNNASIEGASGTAGNIYSNGSIHGSNNVTITGDVSVATGMAEDESYTLNNSDQIFGQTNPIIDVAQSFKPSVSEKLNKIMINVKKIGNPGNMTVRILTDSSDSPSKTTLASGVLYASLVGTSYGWVDVVFSSPANLTAGTNYWIMADASQNNSNYWSWGKDKDKGYGNGIAKYTQSWSAASPVWAEIAGDLNFKSYMGGQLTDLDSVVVLGTARANTITNSKICVDAYYQTIDSSSLSFLNSPGSPCPTPRTPGTAFPGSPDPPLMNMPISDSNINQWKDEATDGGVRSGDLVVSTSSMSFGPSKIDGNLLISNSKTLTVTGTIYVTGHIDISNNASVKCSPAFGLYSCVVVADKWINLSNNGTFQGSGQPGSYIMLLTTSPCDGISPGDCASGNSAINILNNAIGAIFYAQNGLVNVSNNVTATELTGRKINISNNAVVRYEQGLVNANFTSGPGGGWQIINWKEIE